jgi:hypothetical protein
MSSHNSSIWKNKIIMVVVLFFYTFGTWEDSVVGKYTPLHLL